MRSIIAIPTHIGSRRVPEKVLTRIQGIPLLKRVYDATLPMKGVEDRIIAVSDDKDRKVETLAKSISDTVVKTSECKNGTECIAKAVKLPMFDGVDFILCVQSDEIIDNVSLLEEMLDMLKNDSNLDVVLSYTEHGTEYSPRVNSSVEFICDKGNLKDLKRVSNKSTVMYPFREHLGVVAWRKDVLVKYASEERSEGSVSRDNEYYDLINGDYNIGIVKYTGSFISVNTPSDIAELTNKYIKKAV